MVSVRFFATMGHVKKDLKRETKRAPNVDSVWRAPFRVIRGTLECGFDRERKFKRRMLSEIGGDRGGEWEVVK